SEFQNRVSNCSRFTVHDAVDLFLYLSKLPFFIRLSVDSCRCDIAKKLESAPLFFRRRKKRDVQLGALIATLDPSALRLPQVRYLVLVRLLNDLGIPLVQLSI